MSFYRLDKYKDKTKSTTITNDNVTSSPNNNNKRRTTTTTTSMKTPIDRSLPRAPPPGNFNVNYNTFEVKIPNYTFGKAIKLAGAGGLLAVSLGIRYTKKSLSKPKRKLS